MTLAINKQIMTRAFLAAAQPTIDRFFRHFPGREKPKSLRKLKIAFKIFSLVALASQAKLCLVSGELRNSFQRMPKTVCIMLYLRA